MNIRETTYLGVVKVSRCTVLLVKLLNGVIEYCLELNFKSRMKRVLFISECQRLAGMGKTRFLEIFSTETYAVVETIKIL